MHAGPFRRLWPLLAVQLSIGPALGKSGLARPEGWFTASSGTALGPSYLLPTGSTDACYAQQQHTPTAHAVFCLGALPLHLQGDRHADASCMQVWRLLPLYAILSNNMAVGASMAVAAWKYVMWYLNACHCHTTIETWRLICEDNSLSLRIEMFISSSSVMKETPRLYVYHLCSCQQPGIDSSRRAGAARHAA